MKLEYFRQERSYQHAFMIFFGPATSADVVMGRVNKYTRPNGTAVHVILADCESSPHVVFSRNVLIGFS